MWFWESNIPSLQNLYTSLIGFVLLDYEAHEYFGCSVGPGFAVVFTHLLTMHCTSWKQRQLAYRQKVMLDNGGHAQLVVFTHTHLAIVQWHQESQTAELPRLNVWPFSYWGHFNPLSYPRTLFFFIHWCWVFVQK